MDLKERLLARRRVDHTGCWLWLGARTKDGYGRMSWRNRVERVHRLAMHAWLDMPLDEPVMVCHSCDIPSCFNPYHLYEGTQKDNMSDAARKGRTRGGEKPHEFCKVGHALTPSNRMRHRRGCRTCFNEAQKRWYRAKKETIRALDGER